jgi:hypothetical protein
MRLAKLFSASAAMLSANLGDVLHYGSPSQEVLAIVGSESIEEKLEVDGIKRRHVREATIPRTAAASGDGSHVEKVLIHDAVRFAGVDYLVDTILSESERITRCKLARLATHEKTRDAYRRKG